MLGIFHYRRRTASRTDGIPELFGAISGATVITAVTILTRRSALGTGTLHEPVGKEHLAMLAVKLRRSLPSDKTLFFRRRVDLLGESLVLRRIRRVIIVELYLKISKVLEMHRVATRDELFGRDPLLASANHDWSTMGVVGANVDAIIAAKLLKTNPEIGLDIFDEMTEMNVAVRIRQRAGYDNFPIFRHNTPID